jgi:hypothetical protein
LGMKWWTPLEKELKRKILRLTTLAILLLFEEHNWYFVQAWQRKVWKPL